MREAYPNELYHHGILGQKWGKKNGPPYPLDYSDHSAAEKKHLSRSYKKDAKQLGKYNAAIQKGLYNARKELTKGNLAGSKAREWTEQWEAEKKYQNLATDMREKYGDNWHEDLEKVKAYNKQLDKSGKIREKSLGLALDEHGIPTEAKARVEFSRQVGKTHPLDFNRDPVSETNSVHSSLIGKYGEIARIAFEKNGDKELTGQELQLAADVTAAYEASTGKTLNPRKAAHLTKVYAKVNDVISSATDEEKNEKLSALAKKASSKKAMANAMQIVGITAGVASSAMPFVAAGLVSSGAAVPALAVLGASLPVMGISAALMDKGASKAETIDFVKNRTDLRLGIKNKTIRESLKTISNNLNKAVRNGSISEETAQQWKSNLLKQFE